MYELELCIIIFIYEMIFEVHYLFLCIIAYILNLFKKILDAKIEEKIDKIISQIIDKIIVHY